MIMLMIVNGSLNHPTTKKSACQVSMGPVGIPSSAVLQNGLDNSHTQWSRSLSSGQK